jgi:preprotein translocase subunit SecE
MEKPAVPKVTNVALASSRLGRSGPVQFFQEVVAELKKVTWPSRDETMKLTSVVIALSVIVGLFVGGLDALLVQAQKMIFK